jgi:hypothetical protein
LLAREKREENVRNLEIKMSVSKKSKDERKTPKCKNTGKNIQNRQEFKI